MNKLHRILFMAVLCFQQVYASQEVQLSYTNQDLFEFGIHSKRIQEELFSQSALMHNLNADFVKRYPDHFIDCPKRDCGEASVGFAKLTSLVYDFSSFKDALYEECEELGNALKLASDCYKILNPQQFPDFDINSINHIVRKNAQNFLSNVLNKYRFRDINALEVGVARKNSEYKRFLEDLNYLIVRQRIVTTVLNQKLTSNHFIGVLQQCENERLNTSSVDGKQRVVDMLKDIYGIE